MSSTVNVTALHGYLDLASSYDIDVPALLAECGIDYGQLASQQGDILARQLNQLLELTVARTRDPCFGLRLSQRQSHNVYGLVGILMEKSPDVRTAITNGIQYVQLHAQGVMPRLEESGSRAVYTFQLIEGFEQSQTAIDMVIGSGCNIVRLLTGRPDAIDAVYLSRSNPVADEAYRRILRAPVIFEHELNAIVYDRKLLDLPLASHSELLYNNVLDQVEGLFSGIPKRTSDQVRGIITDCLPSGLCSIDAVAQRLDLSRQQLQLRLRKENQSYQQILEDVRKSIATHRLLNSAISITALGELLGYSNQTAFGRAFERWYGMRPTAWRRQQSATENSSL